MGVSVVHGYPYGAVEHVLCTIYLSLSIFRRTWDVQKVVVLMHNPS